MTKARAPSGRHSRHLFARHLSTLAEAGDRKELPQWLDALDALLRRGGAAGLEGAYTGGPLARVAPAKDGAPDLDRSATALLLDKTPPRGHRGRPSNRETGRDLGTMRAAYLADIARRPRTGRSRRVPPALPQPAPPFGAPFCEVATRREFTERDYPEPLRCAACEILGVDAPLVPRRYEREQGGGWRLAVASCPAGHESLDGSRRQALGELPADAQKYWKLILDWREPGARVKRGADRPEEALEKARGAYGVEPVGSVAEVVADFTGILPQPRTVERWIADGRAALHALGYWPWALTPRGRLARRWWRDPRYERALEQALPQLPESLDREAQRTHKTRPRAREAAEAVAAGT